MDDGMKPLRMLDDKSIYIKSVSLLKEKGRVPTRS